MIDAMVHLVAEACSDRSKIQEDEWKRRLVGWRLNPVMIGGELAAVILTNENEIHVASGKKYRGKWLNRSVIRAYLKNLIDSYGYVKTSVSDENSAGRMFVDRLGFEVTGHDNGVTSYQLRKLRHV